MKWKEINRSLAKENYGEDCFNKELFGANIYDPSYESLKLELNKAFRQSLEEFGIDPNCEDLKQVKNIYKFDCVFAIRIYKIFTEGEYLVGIREASNDNIWRYIQLLVVPNIIAARWGNNNTERFYELGNRLYLKILWWYIYLSWTEDENKTKELIMNNINTSDTLAQLVERSGKNGYRIDVYREIMQQKTYCQVNTEEFRKIMVLNSARVKIINPYLYQDGVKDYVSNLINEVRGK